LTEPVKEMVLNSWQNKSRKLGVSAPDGLLVRMNEADKLNLEYLFANVKWKKKDIAELVIHPATDSHCVYFGELTDSRVREHEIFGDSKVLEIAQANMIKIVGFEEVHE
jgi:hypothetical protein